jgi:hypothetical protein
VVAECSTVSGNFPQIARRLLDRIPLGVSARKSYAYDGHTVHYLSSNTDLIVLTFADSTVKGRVAFAFLQEMLERMASGALDSLSEASAESLLRDRMDYYSYALHGVDTIADTTAQIADLKDVMVSNIDKALTRGEAIEELVDKTDYLAGMSFQQKQRAHRVKRRAACRNWRWTMCIVCFLGLLATFLVVYFTDIDVPGVPLPHHHHKDKTTTTTMTTTAASNMTTMTTTAGTTTVTPTITPSVQVPDGDRESSADEADAR